MNMQNRLAGLVLSTDRLENLEKFHEKVITVGFLQRSRRKSACVAAISNISSRVICGYILAFLQSQDDSGAVTQ